MADVGMYIERFAELVGPWLALAWLARSALQSVAMFLDKLDDMYPRVAPLTRGVNFVCTELDGILRVFGAKSAFGQLDAGRSVARKHYWV